VILREYQRADFETLCEIDRRCFEQAIAYSASDMAAILGRRDSCTIVAQNTKGQVVGFIAAVRNGRRGHIITLDVLPRYRKRGLGKRLILRCEELLRQAGVEVVGLETAVGNRAAQALYQSLGYTRVKRLRRYYGNGEDAWVMKKEWNQDHVRSQASSGSR